MAREGGRSELLPSHLISCHVSVYLCILAVHMLIWLLYLCDLAIKTSGCITEVQGNVYCLVNAKEDWLVVALCGDH